MAERLIIGLYSPAQQSGKTTVSAILADRFGFQIKAFATALKRMVTDLMFSAGLSREDICRYSSSDKEVPIPELGDKSFRYLTQTVGTEWGRLLVDKDLWVKLVLNSPEHPPLLVVEDVRFPNEYDGIREAGGQVWRINRPGQRPTTDHPSEGLLENREFDEYIANDGTLAELETKVIAALSGAV